MIRLRTKLQVNNQDDYRVELMFNPIFFKFIEEMLKNMLTY